MIRSGLQEVSSQKVSSAKTFIALHYSAILNIGGRARLGIERRKKLSLKSK